MMKIYYFKEYDLNKINEYLINDTNTYELKDVINYLEDKNISILTDGLYMTYNNGNINIFKYLNVGTQVHLLDFDGENFIESEDYKENMKNNGISSDAAKKIAISFVRSALGFSVFTYCFMKEDNFENNKRSSKKYKVIISSDYIQVKFKKLPVEIKIYDKVEGLCKYEVNDNNVKIISNSLIQNIKTVPSKLYPLPNKDFKVFTSENTFDLEDDKVSNLLTDMEVLIGRCYTNSDNIMKILRENNIKAKYYSGWLLRLNKMVHHAWVVIDDKHLIDVSILRKEDDILDLEFGNKSKINNENLIDTLSEIIEEQLPFKDKYYYGKVGRYCGIYIGSSTNSTDARKSFNDLLKAVPNHPDYQNIDENGVNKTQRALYKNIYGLNI